MTELDAATIGAVLVLMSYFMGLHCSVMATLPGCAAP